MPKRMLKVRPATPDQEALLERVLEEESQRYLKNLEKKLTALGFKVGKQKVSQEKRTQG